MDHQKPAEYDDGASCFETNKLHVRPSQFQVGFFLFLFEILAVHPEDLCGNNGSSMARDKLLSFVHPFPASSHKVSTQVC